MSLCATFRGDLAFDQAEGLTCMSDEDHCTFNSLPQKTSIAKETVQYASLCAPVQSTEDIVQQEYGSSRVDGSRESLPSLVIIRYILRRQEPGYDESQAAPLTNLCFCPPLSDVPALPTTV